MAQHSPPMTSTPAKKPLKSSVNYLNPEKLSSTSRASILKKKIRSPSPTCSFEGKSLVRSSDRMTFDESDTESESRPTKSRSTPISPTKEELKARLAKAEALINSRNRTKQVRTKQVHHAAESLASSEESDGDEKTDDHVYGKNWTKEPMIHLRDNMYCRESIYDEVTAGSNKPTHVVRKLIEGVFNRSKLGNRTCTGRSDRTKGSNVVEKSYPLNFAARNAIIDFAIDHAEETGAEKKTKKELMASIAQKLCEIKDDLRRKQG